MKQEFHRNSKDSIGFCLCRCKVAVAFFNNSLSIALETRKGY